MNKFLIFITSISVFIVNLIKGTPSHPLVVILLGPPGAGKGTHAVALSKKLNLPHISTGDLFRENLSNDTSLGKTAKSFMDKGQLVPDEIVLDMLFDRITNTDCKNGYILDGFPRTLEQARSFEERLPKKAKMLAINLDIEDAPLVERITGRIVCGNCGSPFHKKYLPPKQASICDNCQGELSQRKDDTEEVVIERLKIYHKQTEPLINFYKEKESILHNLDASNKKEVIFDNLLEIVENSR